MHWSAQISTLSFGNHSRLRHHFGRGYAARQLWNPVTVRIKDRSALLCVERTVHGGLRAIEHCFSSRNFVPDRAVCNTSRRQISRDRDRYVGKRAAVQVSRLRAPYRSTGVDCRRLIVFLSITCNRRSRIETNHSSADKTDLTSCRKAACIFLKSSEVIQKFCDHIFVSM